MRHMKTVLSWGLALTLLFGGTACGKNSQGTQKKNTPSNESVNLRWLTTGDGGATPLKEKDRIVDEINKKFNIVLKVEIVPEANYEKVNVEMASKSLPDMVTGAFGTSATQEWINDDLLLALNDYLEGRPALKSRLEDEYQWTADDKGQYYGVPFVTQYSKANSLIVMRQDWLDKLGLSYPKTLDELETVLIAFTQKDPDGNGKNDTVGYTDGGPIGNFNWAYGAYGMKHFDFSQDASGKVIPFFEDNSYKNGLSFLKKLWDQGVIDQEFMLNDTQKKEEKFYQGKAGAMWAPLFRNAARIEKNLQELFPEATIAYGLPPKGPDGAFGANAKGKSGMFTAVTADCKAPDRAADFINFMLSEEGTTLLRWGIENIHYKREGDKVIFNEEERAKDSFAANGWAHALAWGSFFWPLESNYLPEGEVNRERAIETVDLATQAQLPNLVGRKTKAEMDKGSAVNAVYEQAFIAMLQGRVSINDGLNKLSREWRAQGGDAILTDVEAALK